MAERPSDGGAREGAVRAARACPLCGGREVDVVHRRRFVLPEGHPLDAPQPVVACVACGFAYADTPLGQPAYDTYYAGGAKYADASTGTGGGVLPWDDARLVHTVSTIARLAPERSARVADVGCGAGGLLRHLADAGFRSLDGVDPAPACAEMLRGIPGVRGYVGTLLALPPAVLGADGAVLSHVLEHVLDVDAAMSATRRLVRPGGWLYVEVPDASRYAEHVAAPFQDFNVEHINHFSPGTLRALLTRHGFRVRHAGDKVIPASADATYPATWALAENGAAAADAAPPEPDVGLREALRRYVARSREVLGALDARLRAVVAQHPALVVWGTGQTARELLAETALSGARIVAFVDSNPLYHGCRLAGAPVLPPEALPELPYPVLVGSVIAQGAIAARATELGVRDRLLLLDPE